MTDFRIGMGAEKSWGPDDRWGLWFGSGVLEGLLHLIDQFLSNTRSRYGSPAALGCVPWLTHDGVVDRLIRMRTCIVVGKPRWSGPALSRLYRQGQPFPSDAVVGFEDYAPRGQDGEPMIIRPSDRWPPGDSHIGPVRVAGYRGDGLPILHAKMLVLGDVYWAEDEFLNERQWFRPSVIWWGSANWTHAAEYHVEAGTFSDDRTLLDEATTFVSELVKLSEPFTSTSEQPRPEYAPVDFDDDAFAEYMAEYGEPPPEDAAP